MEILPEAAEKRKTQLKQDGRTGRLYSPSLYKHANPAKMYGDSVRNPETEKFLYTRRI